MNNGESTEDNVRGGSEVISSRGHKGLSQESKLKIKLSSANLSIVLSAKEKDGELNIKISSYI